MLKNIISHKQDGGHTMNRQHAEEISKSPDMKHVTYEGKRVFIQHVHENEDIARVYYLDDPTEEFDVQLDLLKEE